MKRAFCLFVLSLGSCLLVASLLSSCTSIPMSLLPVEELLPAPPEEQPPVSIVSPKEAVPPSVLQTQYGMASWYGKAFHGRSTASGEKYDMFQPTAAHRWAPFGTHAVVTNLENGRTVHVRINDRGPARRPYIIDLSYAAAHSLDLVRGSPAQVKVEFFSTIHSLDLAQRDSAWTKMLAPPATSPMLPAFTVQVGPYQELRHATRAQHTLVDTYPKAGVATLGNGSKPQYCVRLGPFPNREAAERAARQVRLQGYQPTVIARAP